MTTTVLEEFSDKKVRVTFKDGREAIEGKVEAANDADGILLVRSKGKTGADLYYNADIENVESLENERTDLAATKLKPVEKKNVRRHLLAAHGWKLSQVNAITDAEALVQHTGLHEGPDAADLGHFHGE